MTDTKDDSARPLSFERDIRPLFRDKDQTSMLKAFDLWSFPDVVAHQDAILEQLRSGHMPCDGAWPAEKVSVFADWISEGSQPLRGGRRLRPSLRVVSPPWPRSGCARPSCPTCRR